MKHISEEQLVLYYYRDAEDSASIAEHLAACTFCRDHFVEVQKFLDSFVMPPTPSPSVDFESKMWQRVGPSLSAPARWDWHSLFRPQRLAAVCTIAVLVVVAFLAGHFWPRPEHPMATPISPKVRERILLVAVGDHLERSQRVLLELLNAPEDGMVDISSEQQRAEDLVESNRLYRQVVEQSGDAGTAAVLDELERVLIQIAHSPSKLSSSDLDEFRRRIENQGILFKVQVIDNQVQQREKEVSGFTVKNQT